MNLPSHTITRLFDRIDRLNGDYKRRRRAYWHVLITRWGRRIALRPSY